MNSACNEEQVGKNKIIIFMFLHLFIYLFVYNFFIFKSIYLQQLVRLEILREKWFQVLNNLKEANALVSILFSF